jgi:thioesterase domain-containing protein
VLYQTGDLARYLPDGNIQFLGRMDGQVKLRGFRIELGEIECALNQHPAIRESAVILAETGSGEKRLVAYIVSTDPIPTIKELHDFLGQRLPDYMLPALVVPLDALPLTANGKLDRRALPKPGETHAELREAVSPPRDLIETKLVDLWEKLLDIRPIGIADNFFHLGGHSLLAVRLSAQVERTFGSKLPLALLYHSPTIEQLAPALRNGEGNISIGAPSSIVPIQTYGTRAPLFLVHGAGGGMFWGYVNLSRHLGPEQPVYGFRSRGLDGREELSSLEQLASSYVADLRNFQPRGPYYLGGYCFGGNVAHEMARQLTAQGERVAFLALLNSVPPNSGYGRILWTPLWALRFTRNLFYWLNYFRHWNPKQRHEFISWKIGLFKKRLARLGDSDPERLTTVEPGDLVDLSSYSPEQRDLWETHIRALLAYHPRAYSGAAHLFRSPVHPFWCSFAPDYGWRGLAKGGVQTIIVPGAHEQILEEPYVQTLAGELRQALRSVETCFQPASKEHVTGDTLANSELASISAG